MHWLPVLVLLAATVSIVSSEFGFNSMRALIIIQNYLMQIECNRIINTNTRITKIRLIAGDFWSFNLSHILYIALTHIMIKGRSRNLRLKQIISCCGRYRCNGLLRKKNGGRHSRNRTVIIKKIKVCYQIFKPLSA